MSYDLLLSGWPVVCRANVFATINEFKCVLAFLGTTLYASVTLGDGAELYAEAESTILVSQMVAKSASARGACRAIKDLCVGSRTAELALSLLGSDKSAAGTARLLKLTRYQMGGALGEQFDCAVLKRRSKAKVASTIRAAELRSECNRQFSELKARYSAAFSDLAVNDVCRSEQEVKQALQQADELVQRGAGSACE